jgi:hypothetical protein
MKNYYLFTVNHQIVCLREILQSKISYFYVIYYFIILLIYLLFLIVAMLWFKVIDFFIKNNAFLLF